MNMGKAAKIIGKEARITQEEAIVAVKTFLGLIEEDLYQDGKCWVYGLGTFSVFTTKETLACNGFSGPKTKLVPSRQVVKFRASEVLNRNIIS